MITDYNYCSKSNQLLSVTDNNNQFSVLLARDSIYAIARSLLSPVRLSVCLSVRLSVPLSVTRVDQSKTVEVRITQPSPQSSPMTLVS